MSAVYGSPVTDARGAILHAGRELLFEKLDPKAQLVMFVIARDHRIEDVLHLVHAFADHLQIICRKVGFR